MKLSPYMTVSYVVASLYGCITVSPQQGPTIGDCPQLPDAATERPTREAFFREVLFSEPTPRTPLFDDYTPASYHVDKLDLASGLQASAQQCGVRPLGLVVVGPLGPLWTYHIISLQAEGTAARVNWLVMPHARITRKGTAIFGSLDAKGWLRDVIAAGELKAGLPRNQPPGLPPAIKEIPFEILIALWGEGDPSYWHGWIENGWFDIDGDATDQMLDVINDLLGRMLITYPATE